MPPPIRRFARTVVALASLSACSSDPRPATWSYISPVLFQPSCATPSCHSRAAAVSGLDFSDPDCGYSSLTELWVWVVDSDAGPGCAPVNGTTVCEKQFRPLVVPFNKDESRLVKVLRAQNAPRMPPDWPFSEADIKLVEAWIMNGATKSDRPSSTDALTDAP